MILDEEQKKELLKWAKQGISVCFESKRGAYLFGASARVKEITSNTLLIETRKEGQSGPVYWELTIIKKL